VKCSEAEDVLTLHYGTIVMRKLMSRYLGETTNIAIRIIDNELLPIFVGMIKQTAYKQLQLEAGWIISNVASTNEDFCEKIVQKGCIEPFI
jgi:hypothetical protein